MSQENKPFLQDNIKDWWNLDLDKNNWARALKDSENAEWWLKKSLAKTPKLPPLSEQTRALAEQMRGKEDISDIKSRRMAQLDAKTLRL